MKKILEENRGIPVWYTHATAWIVKISKKQYVMLDYLRKTRIEFPNINKPCKSDFEYENPYIFFLNRNYYLIDTIRRYYELKGTGVPGRGQEPHGQNPRGDKNSRFLALYS